MSASPDQGSGNGQEVNGVSFQDTLDRLQCNLTLGLTETDVIERKNRYGKNEIPENKQNVTILFLSKFWGLSAWMIELIALLSWAIHRPLDMGLALFLLLVNALLSFFQEQRASKAATALKNRLQVTVRVLRDGQWASLPAQELVPGDVVRVRSGDFVPADLLVVQGGLEVDQSALTGESVELTKNQGDSLYSGSVIRHGEATAVVAGTGTHTWFGRTAQLVDMAHPALHVEAVIAQVVKWLLVLVVLLVVMATGVALARQQALLHLLPVILAVLMNAIPVALPVMFTVSMALGSLELMKQGVLITRLGAVEDAATMNVLCADKTGTLTCNQLSLVDVMPFEGFDRSDLIRIGIWASQEANQDPIDLAFIAAGRPQVPTNSYRQTRFIPFSAATRYTESEVESGGETWQCIKGAIRTVSELACLSAGEVGALEAKAREQASLGRRTLALACAPAGSDEQQGRLRFVGLAFLYDPPRPDSTGLLKQLSRLGIRVLMLTGDALPVAKEVGKTLGLTQIVRIHEMPPGDDSMSLVDGYAEVFPEDKFRVVKTLQQSGHVVGMTGDGVNDAPALRQAEVGIAVQGATDVAKSAASAILTEDGLVNIVSLVMVGRSIYQRILTWILYKVSQTIVKSGFVVMTFVWFGHFALSLLGIILLVFMNDFVMISLATDPVPPSTRPETWNIAPQVKVAAILGLLDLFEALGILNWQAGSGRAPILLTQGFEVVSAFALFSVLSLRERGHWWHSLPSRILLTACAGDFLLAWLVGLHGLQDMQPLDIRNLIIIYATCGFLVLGPNDWLKSLLMQRALKGRSNSPDTVDQS